MEKDKRSYIFERQPQYIEEEERLIDIEETADSIFTDAFTDFDENPKIDFGRIRRKQKELGIKIKEKQNKFDRTTTRYGRSPLHEAIAMKDINSVKKYAGQEIPDCF